MTKKNFRGDTGLVRAAFDACGFRTDMFMFNDIRKKSGYRRIKVWVHVTNIDMYMTLKAACQKKFGWRMIAAGICRDNHGQNNFTVKLKL